MCTVFWPNRIPSHVLKPLALFCVHLHRQCTSFYSPPICQLVTHCKNWMIVFRLMYWCVLLLSKLEGFSTAWNNWLVISSASGINVNSGWLCHHREQAKAGNWFVFMWSLWYIYVWLLLSLAGRFFCCLKWLTGYDYYYGINVNSDLLFHQWKQAKAGISFAFVWSLCVCVCACVRACVHACVRACVRAWFLFRLSVKFTFII